MESPLKKIKAFFEDPFVWVSAILLLVILGPYLTSL